MAKPETPESELIKERIKAAQSFDDLFSTLDDMDKMGIEIGGSEGLTNAQHRERIQKFREYKGMIMGVTQAFDLRDKVSELAHKESLARSTKE